METKPPVPIGESQNNDMRTPTEVQAATKIQAGFRGYKVRKQLKQKNESPEGDKQRRSSRPKNNTQIPKEIEEKSAVKIQAGVRGFLVRRRQKKQTDITAQ
nr:unnamed protein product [Callosobruchus analis]